jgi:glycosyltransferase involved in cell wall biosynthesis
LRWEAIAKHWEKNGHDLKILTTKHSERKNYEKEGAIEIFRTGEVTLLDFYYNKMKTKSRRNDFSQSNKEPKPSKGLRFMEKLIDLTWRKFYWPDGSCLFLKPGKKLAKKLISENEIDVVISIGLPFTCHLIARELKLKSPKIKWIMDIQDPFCYSKEFWVNNFSLYEQKNLREEKRAFEIADHVVLTNTEAKNKYLEYFPMYKRKLHCIPPLFREEVYSPEETAISFDKKFMNLVYAGSFYENVRSPESFLGFITQISQNDPDWLMSLRFHFIGQYSSKTLKLFYQNKNLSENILLHGPIKHATIFNTLKQADFLLNFGNTTNYHLPSKCVEYLAIGKPIVNIISTDSDSFKLFIKDSLPTIHLNLKETDDHLSKLKEFMSKNLGFSLPSKSINRLVTPYKPDKIADSYFQLISSDANEESRTN